MDPTGDGAQLRQVAFEQVNRLAALNGSILSSDDLAAGFQFQGERIPLINPQTEGGQRRRADQPVMRARAALDDHEIPGLEIAYSGGMEGLHRSLPCSLYVSIENAGPARSSTAITRLTEGQCVENPIRRQSDQESFRRLRPAWDRNLVGIDDPDRAEF